jgi:hypothetical protein
MPGRIAGPARLRGGQCHALETCAPCCRSASQDAAQGRMRAQHSRCPLGRVACRRLACPRRARAVQDRVGVRAAAPGTFSC